MRQKRTVKLVFTVLFLVGKCAFPTGDVFCFLKKLAAQMQVEGIIIERDSISRIEIRTRFVPDYELPVFSKVLNVSVDWLLGL